MEIYDMTIEDATQGVSLISIVDRPAIGEMFVTLSEDEVEVKLSLDPKKKIVLGAALIPDKLIYRADEEGGYYIRFSKEVIEDTVNKFFDTPNKLKLMDVNHNADLVPDVKLVSSYLLSEDLKDRRFSHLPEGSWIVGYKINNESLWNDIEKGKVKGFSIEGKFKPVHTDSTLLSEVTPVTPVEFIDQVELSANKDGIDKVNDVSELITITLKKLQ